MKKVLILVVTYFFLGIISSTFKSCKPFEYAMKDIYFQTITYGSKLPEFKIHPSSRVVSTTVFSRIKNIDLIPSVYATTVCEKLLNDLVFSSFSMSFDKNILFDSEIIEPGTDIFQLETLKNYILIEKDDWCRPSYSIKFSSEIEDRLVFEAGEEYTVYFSCETTDGLEFNKSTRMTIK